MTLFFASLLLSYDYYHSCLNMLCFPSVLLGVGVYKQKIGVIVWMTSYPALLLNHDDPWWLNHMGHCFVMYAVHHT